MKFNAAISNIKQVNPLFSECNIKVLYAGANRNKSFISKQSVDRALPTIYNIPIVGEFLEKKEDFGTHGGKVEITDQEIKFVQTTKPYGVVPESATIYWQPIAEKDGVVNEYLIIEGAYLWTGRYSEASKVISNSKGQSMEIEIIKGDFNKDKLFVVEDFVFSALCILGDDVEPCFESAEITAFNFSKDDFKHEFTTMLKELKMSLSTDDDVEKYSEEGESVNLLLELLAKYSFTEEMIAEKGVNLSEITPEDLEAKLIEYTAELSAQEDGTEQNEVEETAEFTDKGEEVAEEFTEGEVAADTADEVQEDVAADEVEQPAEDYTAQIAELQETVNGLTQENEALKTERDQLFAFKQQVEQEQHKIQVEDMFAKFDKLEESEIQEVREKMFEMTLEEIEEKLYFMLGKKVAQFSLNPKKKDSIKIDVVVEEVSDKKGYALSHLFEKYNK